MALALNDAQVLPDGIHDATMEDVRELFGQFHRTDRRMRLCDKLEEYVQELRSAKLGQWLLVDGSFIMACVNEPEDVDLMLVLPETWDLSAALKPFQYNLLSKRMVKKKFPFDLFIVPAGSEAEVKWTEFFSMINPKWYEKLSFPERSIKGLVRIAL